MKKKEKCLLMLKQCTAKKSKVLNQLENKQFKNLMQMIRRAITLLPAKRAKYVQNNTSIRSS